MQKGHGNLKKPLRLAKTPRAKDSQKLSGTKRTKGTAQTKKTSKNSTSAPFLTANRGITPKFRFLKLARYYSSVTLLYAGTLLFAAYLFNPSIFHQTVQSRSALDNTPSQPMAEELSRVIKVGQPVRLIIERLGMDLPVEAGYYNPDDGSWTLADGKKISYFAMPSSLLNDYSGSTMIYGHNNRFVFGPLDKLIPGDIATVHAGNNHVFKYTFTSSVALKPDDVSVFDYQGPPQLSLQTCTGNWYEWRTMYYFNLAEVKS